MMLMVVIKRIINNMVAMLIGESFMVSTLMGLDFFTVFNLIGFLITLSILLVYIKENMLKK